MNIQDWMRQEYKPSQEENIDRERRTPANERSTIMATRRPSAACIVGLKSDEEVVEITISGVTEREK